MKHVLGPIDAATDSKGILAVKHLHGFVVEGFARSQYARREFDLFYS